MARLNTVERGSGFPILLGHSLALDHASFEAQVDILARSFRVIALDFPGHGRSGPARACTLEDLAQDVLALAPPRFGYAGLSLGGMVGMRVALTAPGRVAALALLDTDAQAMPEDEREAYRASLELYRRTGPSEPLTGMMLGLFFRAEFQQQRPAVVQRVRDRLMANDPERLYPVSLAVVERTDVLDRLSRLDVPTLVLVGAQDVPTPPGKARAIRDAIAGAEYVEIPDSGHLSILEQPERVSRELESFFKRTLTC